MVSIWGGEGDGLLGYAPLGFLQTLALYRTNRRHASLVRVVLTAAGLSLLMESLQMFLPVRVPSNVDAVLNVCGAISGAVVARGLAWAGMMDRWGRFRDRWFGVEARGCPSVWARCWDGWRQRPQTCCKTHLGWSGGQCARWSCSLCCP